jgi:hypothetical protein
MRRGLKASTYFKNVEESGLQDNFVCEIPAHYIISLVAAE